MQVWCTDPHWDGTTAEQLGIHLLSVLFNYTFFRCYIYKFISHKLIKPTFSKFNCGVIKTKVDSDSKFSITTRANTTERDFKSEYLFCMCSVATNLVTSLKTNRIHCATTLRLFGRTQNGYIATHFILLSSTAKSSATGGYVVVPEGFGQKADLPSRNEERTRKTASFVPSGRYKLFNM